MARYRDAIRWIADNDDADIGDPDEGGYIISVHLVADLWGKDPAAVACHVKRRRIADGRAHQRQIDGEEMEEARMMESDPMYEGLL